MFRWAVFEICFSGCCPVIIVVLVFEALKNHISKSTSTTVLYGSPVLDVFLGENGTKKD